MHVTSLTPVVNCWNRVNKSKVWIDHQFIVLKSLGIDCGSTKWSNGDVSVRFWNGLTSLTSTFFSAWYLFITRTFCSRIMTWDLQTSKKLNSDVEISYPTFLWFPWCLCVFLMIKWSSDKVWVTVNKFCVHSWHVIRCFLLHYAVFCLANVKINTSPAYFYGIWKVSFPRKHVMMSLGLSNPVYSQATQPWRL